ncbi:phosphopantetheine-binding protein, partial [Streptomyces sp. NPDC006967]|uniref:phosphopantetheine-binding protein n=1 Tax=Streptomyces sp. NPDC006967 TaxID=3156906 RepID=UPI0033DDFF69
RSTTAQHHGAAPRRSTTAQHHGAAPRRSTTAQHHGAGYVVPPALLDSALQSALAPLLGSDWKTAGGFLSEGMGRVTVHGTAHGEVWAHAVCRAGGASQREVDVRMYSLDGTLLVEVVGMRIVRLESVPILAAPRPQQSASDGQVPLVAPAGGLRVTIAALPSGPERRKALESAVRENVAQVVRLPARRVDPDRPLKSLGIDSLMSLELRNRLEGAFGIRLSATLIWNYPTVHDIVPFLAEKLGLELDDEAATVQAPVAAPTGAGGGRAPSSAESPEELLERELAELDERMETI